MRIGFKVINNSLPLSGVRIIGTITPFVITTDENGEAFAISPSAINIAQYAIDIILTCTKGNTIYIQDIANEISTYYTVDFTTKTWSKETLPKRIAGDGFYNIDKDILNPEELIISTTDPMLRISNCAMCLYFNRLQNICIVNGKFTLPIQIDNPALTTSRKYYPLFLPPSEDRIILDIYRLGVTSICNTCNGNTEPNIPGIIKPEVTEPGNTEPGNSEKTPGDSGSSKQQEATTQQETQKIRKVRGRCSYV